MITSDGSINSLHFKKRKWQQHNVKVPVWKCGDTVSCVCPESEWAWQLGRAPEGIQRDTFVGSGTVRCHDVCQWDGANSWARQRWAVRVGCKCRGVQGTKRVGATQDTAVDVEDGEQWSDGNKQLCAYLRWKNPCAHDEESNSKDLLIHRTTSCHDPLKPQHSTETDSTQVNRWLAEMTRYWINTSVQGPLRTARLTRH